MKDLFGAFIFGFGVGAVALGIVGTRVTKEITRAKDEMAGLLERVAQAVERK
jgi:hypothetical protein